MIYRTLIIVASLILLEILLALETQEHGIKTLGLLAGVYSYLIHKGFKQSNLGANMYAHTGAWAD